MSEIHISVVLPVLNEAGSLLGLYERLTRVLQQERYEILFVNDGSTDDSGSILERLRKDDSRVRVLTLARCFGHQRAVTAGLDFAKGSACIVMDSDGQHPPEVIPEFLDRWRKGFHVVNARREGPDTEHGFKRWSASAFYWLFRRLTRLDVVPNSADFCLIDRQVVDVLKQMRESHRFLRALRQWAGGPQTVITYARESRQHGERKYSLWRMMALAADAITSFSIIPLRLAAWTGLSLSVLSGFYLVYGLYVRLILKAAIPGWASLLAVALFLGSIQLLMLGIIGEYVGRIYEEVKGRPLYVVKSFD